MATISERIKEGLELRKITQSELVSLTKLNKSSISSYLSGKYEPKQKAIYLIAKALNVSESWLMGYDVDYKRNAPETEVPKADERFDKIWSMYSSLSDEDKDAADKYLAFLLDNQKNG